MGPYMLWEALQVAWAAMSLCCGACAALPPLFACVAVAVFLTRRPPSRGRFALDAKCIAHRGAMLDAPQNTLAALKHCASRGCDAVEVDVRVTRDGVCVLWHDQRRGARAVADTDWSELRAVDVAAEHPLRSRFGTVNPCTMEDALDYVCENRMRTIVDVKSADGRVCAAVVEAFKKRPQLYENAVVASFNPIVVYKIRTADPSIIGGMTYRANIFSSLSSESTGRQIKRYQNNIFLHYIARVCDVLYACVWTVGILPYWVGSSVIILHKDITSLYVVERWRKANYSVITWGVNQPVDKHYTEKILGIPYITDTLIGEPTVHREMNGKTKY